MAFLPDAWQDRTRTHHRITSLAPPGCPELGHVAQWPIPPPFRWRVLVGTDLPTEELRPGDLAPHLRPSEEEALFRGEAVDLCARIIAERALHRRVRNGESAEVSDVLAERQLSVHVRGWIEHRVRVELPHDLVSFRDVERPIFLAPPVAEIAGLVVLSPLIVERVRHLVPDDGTHRTIVHRFIRVRIEERRLQDSGGKYDLVQQRVLVRVHGGWRHPPFRSIRRLADLWP